MIALIYIFCRENQEWSTKKLHVDISDWAALAVHERGKLERRSGDFIWNEVVEQGNVSVASVRSEQTFLAHLRKQTGDWYHMQHCYPKFIIK